MEAQRPASFQISPMAGTHFWKQLLKSQFQSTPSHRSWEEKAFAEDTAGAFGGSVWPPRSYSCNFCMREFRSAQALGGHMNVHRRDRARLQQSLINPISIPIPDRSSMAVKNNNNNIVETDLSMNSFVKLQNKRPKISISASESLCDLLFFNSTTEEEKLDLELRLGDPPKVN